MVEHNFDNCEKLATATAQSWDLDGLMEFAIEKLFEVYYENPEAFHNDWPSHFGGEDQ